ncbi:MAG: hypothetical protein COB36_01900 [Alphaproteobacteria bacterium]|nr:MAG: hypothetical protein COB36_01900 [Alphaproteobacteria bacterium]
MGGNDDGVKGKFDANRTIAMMMAEKGVVPTGDGSFLEISSEAGEKIAEDIGDGASFSDNDTDGLTP